MTIETQIPHTNLRSVTNKKSLTNSLASPEATLWHTILSTERFQIHAVTCAQLQARSNRASIHHISSNQAWTMVRARYQIRRFFFAFILSPTERAYKLLRHERSDAGKLSLPGHSDYDVDTQMIDDFANSQLVRLPTYTTAVLDRTAHVQCTPSCSPWVNVSL